MIVHVQYFPGIFACLSLSFRILDIAFDRVFDFANQGQYGMSSNVASVLLKVGFI